MKLSQRIAIRRSIAARAAVVTDAPVEITKKPRSEKQLASDARFGEMIRARREAARLATESLAA